MGIGGRVRLALVAVIMACTLTQVVGACSGPPANPYAQEFEIALDGSTTEFERTVLEDGVITRDEYQEAHELWLACMEQTFPPDAGRVVTLVPNAQGLYGFRALGFSSGEEEFYDSVADSCSIGTIESIAPLYASVTSNPQKEDPATFVVACLKRHDLVLAEYSVENWKADLAASSGAVVTQIDDANTGESVFVTGAPPEYDPELVTGLDVDQDAVFDCQVNPNS
jgi:hypothetical protein